MKTAAILVVDDEPSMLEILVEWLVRGEYANVRSAGDGQEALEMCCADSYELVISDINMPRMDGITLLRNLRELGHRMPAIVFVSGILFRHRFRDRHREPDDGSHACRRRHCARKRSA